MTKWLPMKPQPPVTRTRTSLIVVGLSWESVLHVTNGSSAGNLIAHSGLEGDVLTWDDVLHEGPLPARVGPGALGQIRARFLTTAGWGDYPTIVAKLGRGRHARLHRRRARRARAGRFPPLFETRQPVEQDEYELARRAWDAFRHISPESVDRLRAEDLSRLPYLADALTRLLQELPWSTDGLSRTERALLMPLYDGPRRFDEAFLAQMRAEEGRFSAIPRRSGA